MGDSLNTFIGEDALFGDCFAVAWPSQGLLCVGGVAVPRPSPGAALGTCATGCAVQRAWRGAWTDRHHKGHRQDRPLPPALTAELALVWNQVHAASVFIGMWEFTCIKTEKNPYYCHFINLTVNL